MVAFPVAFIDRFELVAGNLRAFVAEIHGAFRKQSAPFFQKCTVFIPRAAPQAVCHPDTLFFYIVGCRKIPATDTAVHPAGCNEIFIFIHTISDVIRLLQIFPIVLARRSPLIQAERREGKIKKSGWG
jgi:hypothetical protein